MRNLLSQHRDGRSACCRSHGTRDTATEQADACVQGHAVLAAFVPLASFGFVAITAQVHGLVIGVAGGNRNCLLPKRLRDGDLSLDLIAHTIFVEDGRYAGFGVAGARRRVARNAGDGRLCGAAGRTLVRSDPCAAVAELAAHACSHAAAACFEAGSVVDVAGGQPAFALERVEVLVDGRLAARDGPALEICATPHVDLEAPIASADSGLFTHGGQVAVDPGLARADAGARCGAEGHRTPNLLALLVEDAGVLQAFNRQAAADVCLHAGRGHHGAAQRCITPGVDAHLLACFDAGVAVHGLLARAVALAGAGGHRDACFCAQADADAGAAVLAAAALLGGVLGSEQLHVALGAQGGHLPGLHPTALDEDVRALARANSAQAHITPGGERGALCVVALALGAALALAGADADAHGDARALRAAASRWFTQALQRVVTLQRGGGCPQRLHARVLGLAHRLGHLYHTLCGFHQGAAQADGDTSLFELLFGGGALGDAGLGDGDGLRPHVDATPRSKHIGACLGIRPPCGDAHVARDGTHGGGGRTRVLALLIGALLLAAQRDAATRAEEAAGLLLVEVAVARAGLRGGDGHVAPCRDVDGVIGNGAGALECDVPSALHHHLGATQCGAHGVGAAVVGAVLHAG